MVSLAGKNIACALVLFFQFTSLLSELLPAFKLLPSSAAVSSARGRFAGVT
jgi:hypothetical protein